jgi:hypothetical protein
MKTFRQLREQLVIEAAGTNQKGWINYKTNKIVLWNYNKAAGKPWHIQFVCKHPKKFGLTEKKILFILSEAGWVDPNEGEQDIPDDETKKQLGNLKSGIHDTQVELRMYLEGKGWMEFYNESNRGIDGGNNRASTKDLHSAAKVLEKALSVSSTVEFDKALEVNLHGAIGTPNVRVTDRFAWKTFLRTGKVAKARSALAAFR